MQRLMIVKGKLERWKTLFDDMPGYRCDVRTIVIKIDKSEGTVEVEQQFWFKHVRTRIYLSDLAMKRARRFYKSLDLDKHIADWGSRQVGDKFYFWATVKVYN